MYDKIRRLQDIDVKNKTVILRTNFDVPISPDGEVLDETRIKASIPTIEHLQKNNCKIVIISHLGRPNGKAKDSLSLMPVRFTLGRLLNTSIKFAHLNACENSIKFMEENEILLIENLRFNKGEESENEEERKEAMKTLADLGDVYVNDAFGVHRDHASIVDLPNMMTSVAGLSIQKEIEELSKFNDDLRNPFVLILGGAKVNTKVPLVKFLVKKVDTILIGGAMAYTFLKAQGVDIGKSKYEEDMIKTAKEILDLAKKNNTEVLLPVDHIGAKEFDEEAKPIKIDTQQLPEDIYGLDIGPKTLVAYREVIESAKTILWNGPMGVFEWENFNTGTEAVGEYIALGAGRDAFKVAGGGDTTYALHSLKIKEKRFSHVSIGGGMMLQFLTGEKFKVLDILSEE